MATVSVTPDLCLGALTEYRRRALAVGTVALHPPMYPSKAATGTTPAPTMQGGAPFLSKCTRTRSGPQHPWTASSRNADHSVLRVGSRSSSAQCSRRRRASVAMELATPSTRCLYGDRAPNFAKISTIPTSGACAPHQTSTSHVHHTKQ